MSGTATPQPHPIVLPAISVILLADALTELDAFLRSGVIADDLADFLTRRGRGHADYYARTLIDELSLAATHLRRLTAGVDRRAAAYAHLADYLDVNNPPGR